MSQTRLVRLGPLVGDIDASTAEDIAEVPCAGTASVTNADLAGVTFIDSSGLAELIRAKHAFAASGRDLLIRGAQPNVRRVFEILGLDEILSDWIFYPGQI